MNLLTGAKNIENKLLKFLRNVSELFLEAKSRYFFIVGTTPDVYAHEELRHYWAHNKNEKSNGSGR